MHTHAHRAAAGVLLAVLLAVAMPATAREATPRVAGEGMELALTAARAWAEDAVLLYVESDDAVDESGRSQRWGYLFHSPARDAWRGYSVRDGRIVVAEDPGVKLDAPSLVQGWIDSDAALRAAEAGEGGSFRRAHGAHVRTMLLMRGAFADQDPDAATWTVVYSADNAPSLFVVVDAGTARVRRWWRG